MCRAEPIALLAVALVLVGAGAAAQSPRGPFHPPASYAAGGTTLSGLAIGDLTGDGSADLLAVARGEHRVQLLPGVSDGVFSSPRPLTAGGDPLRVAIGDIDADSRFDLLAIGHFDNAFLVRRGLAAGELGEATSYGLRNHGRQIAVVDVNADGFDDAVAAHDGSGQPIYVAVYLGNADGVMRRAWEFGSQYATSKNIVSGDFDGDGHRDLAVGAGDDRTSVLVFRGMGTGEFAGPTPLPPISPTPGAADGTERLAAADLNDDGFDDLVAVHRELANLLSIRLGSGSGFAAPVVQPLPVPGDIALGDLDGDAIPDAVISLPEQSALAVLPGIGDGSFGPRADIAVGSAPTWLALHDLDADGWLDVAVTDLGDDTVHALLNRGAGVCGGDCDRSETVTIDELVSGIAIALQHATPDSCRAMDEDRDGTVVIAEIIGAVRSVLIGCS